MVAAASLEPLDNLQDLVHTGWSGSKRETKTNDLNEKNKGDNNQSPPGKIFPQRRTFEEAPPYDFGLGKR